MKTVSAIRNHKKYLFLFLIIYLFLLASFYFFSTGTQAYRLFLHMRRYILPALACTLAVFAWQKKGLPVRGLLPHILMGVSCSLIFNICDFIAHRQDMPDMNHFGDPLFGGIAFAFTVLLRVFSFHMVPVQGYGTAFVFGLIHTVLLAVPFFELLYFFFYGTTISVAACIAFLQSNLRESFEFARQSLGMGGMAALAFGYLVLLMVFTGLNLLTKDNTDQPEHIWNRKLNVGMAVVFLAVGLYLPHGFGKTGVMQRFLEAREYMASMEDFKKFHTEQMASLQVSPDKPLFSKPSTVIFVIGESAGRNFMSVYGYAQNDTTPWQRKMVTEDPRHFLRFNHAYTSYGSTLQALERALTQKNQYNEKEFSRSVTIMDIAKKAGYKTYWFSNQNTTPITLIAKTADRYYQLEDDPANQGRVWHDGDLLRCLDWVDPNENNFVVIHVMGCHELTMHRFPPEFARFGKAGVFDLIPNYEDAMAYNDYVLQQIFTYAQTKLNLQAMILFSDHGANPYRKRTADNVPFISLRIPLICYLSDEYQRLYPATVSAMRAHLDTYFTNDLMYETVSGILGVKSDQIDEKNSLTSPLYQYTRETLKTDLGTRSLAKDDSENRIEIVR